MTISANSVSKASFLTHLQKRCDQVKGTDAEDQFESFRERVQDTPGATVAQMLQVTDNAGKIAHQHSVQTMIKGGLVAGLGAAIACIPGAQVVGGLIAIAGLGTAGAVGRVDVHAQIERGEFKDMVGSELARLSVETALPPRAPETAQPPWELKPHYSLGSVPYPAWMLMSGYSGLGPAPTFQGPDVQSRWSAAYEAEQKSLML